MSRGFVKEDDQEDIPMVPPRANLPDGVTNYVTPAGMRDLLAEKQKLTDEKNQLEGNNENERRIALNFINSKLHLLNKRIDEAKIIQLHEQPQLEIRFGATIKLKALANQRIQTFQIVGVDEASITKGKISFLSPLAKVLLNKKIGEKAVLKREKDETVFEILDISYQ
jgi:transcription elongation factor GreB